MGIFDKFRKKNNAQIEVEVTATQTQETPTTSTDERSKINLRKETLNKVCLEKKIDDNFTARVKVVIDYSGSMDYLYESGKVQEILNRLLPLGLKFDNDAQAELFIFSNNYKELKPLNINNYENYIKNENILKKYDMGGTNYSPVINKIIKDEKRDKTPTFVIFITDGDNWDKEKTEKAIKEASKYSIFWQFVGIGSEEFDFLEELDDLSGRVIDNADFIKVSDMEKVSDRELYTMLLGEFPEWIKAAKEKNII